MQLGRRTFIIGPAGAALLSGGAVAQEALKKGSIGVVVQLTGVSGEFGVEVQHAIEIAQKDLKNADVIDLSATYEDDQLQPALALVEFEKLADMKDVSAVISNGSSILLAIGPVANKRQRLIVNIAGVTPKLRALKPWVVNMIPTSDVEGAELTKLIYGELGLKTAATIHSNDEYGISSADIFAKAYKAAGGRILADESNEVGAVDMRTQLLKIKSVNPQALVIFSNEGENPYIVAQAREIGLPARLFGNSFMLRAAAFKIAGDAMNGLRGVSFRFDPGGSEAAKLFVAKYTKAAGHAPDVSGALAYDAARLMGEAIAKVGPESNAVRAYIVSVKDWPGVVGKVNFDSDGTIILKYMRFQIENGKVVYSPAKS